MPGVRSFPFLLVLLSTPTLRERFPLPKDAVITHLRRGFDPKANDAATCRGFSLSAAQVRHRFRTYHRLAPGEEHDHYLWLPCWVNGTIVYRGTHFSFRARAAHMLWTTWPDGQQKEMGGVYDDDPSGR